MFGVQNLVEAGKAEKDVRPIIELVFVNNQAAARFSVGFSEDLYGFLGGKRLVQVLLDELDGAFGRILGIADVSRSIEETAGHECEANAKNRKQAGHVMFS